ncbi:Ribosome maturation factor RimM OS=Tsukamurella paurometabola (strain ATCC 8368 / DSM / CCUG 35730 / CIP 100753 / JCM 10117 / KCTC 9821 / NBRC 16120 / NCIMB 702349 / NCTC 13040) OX=521096 GN=rimM PE=3 SV=1 [Tsukamurella paurometabola]|uniref:Ribosome maturation factor RimM n=1 Tax=Tsukamurella paurometabola (strain ATCC 8368 / DSM 20162 / CCUG 35730 / CIP 100753 / JCM 10117 / KCTC 9821 / NBRC 16120 / NCIMB 702349 / NCTC 13040) TaxID=521096 RepID=D5UYD3_TSUPD|nr:ribosome maturation factor RimM [Tsukamurella paurometabola]ADG78240.1 16S rRNA processing protein RimM [Tsukamurella paurometabola DSM 20162]SUP30829.1 Ribosome maturation factor rimM [Tsukamurella paurometabola]
MELVVGRVAKSHGIRGEIVVDVRTDSPELRFADGAVLTGRRPRAKDTQTYTVAASREHSGRLLVRLEGVTDRTAADELRGTLFVIDSADVQPSDDPDEFYDHELEGLAVRTADGTEVGVIAEVLHPPGGELLSVKAPDGREILIPFVTAIVPVVDVAGGFIEIDPPEGLLDPE